MKKLWNDESGAVLSAELVLIMTIVVIGLVVGLKALQASVVSELTDVGLAVGSVNQSYSYTGAENCLSSVAGSSYSDTLDGCLENGGTVLDLNVAAEAEITAP